MKAEKLKRRNANIFFQLTRRHFLVFFKSKMTVLYTLLVPIIVFAIYILFLKDLEMMTVENALANLNINMDSVEGLESALTGVIDSWMMSGILGVSAITVCIQTNYIFVRDKDQGINRDFSSSPIKGSTLIASYFVFSFLVTLMISLLFVLVSFLYLYCQNEFTYDFVDFIAIIGSCVLATASATLCLVFICSFIKKESSLTSIIAIFSTAIGFLIGAYTPIQMLPEAVQYFCAFIPATHATGIYRYVFLASPFERLESIVANIEGGASIVASVQDSFGFNLNFFGREITPGYMALVVITYMFLFLIANLFACRNLTKTSENISKRFKRSTNK